MKRVIYDAYGTVDGLRCVDAPTPAVSERQVLVQVKAVALNPIDWKVLEGQLKLVTGSKFPRGIASEFAGVVAATGAAVTQFSVGDEVFGMLDALKGGALAEFIAVDEALVHGKPRALSFAEASALPVGGLSGLQIVDDLVGVRPGMKVLVNGAGGGVGTFVTQLALRRGARVTAVVSSRGVALARSWSCEAVVDYSTTTLSTLHGDFDAVVDLSDKLPFRLARPLLAPSGTYVSALPNPVDLLAGFANNLVSARKRRILRMKLSRQRLAILVADATTWLKVVLGKSYAFANFKEAYASTRTSGTIGKAVITLD